MTASDQAGPVRYRFGDSTRAGVVLGLSVRQTAPLVVGVVCFTLCLAAQQPVVGVAGLVAAAVVAFGRWRRAPLCEIAAPATALLWRRLVRRGPWIQSPLLGTGPGLDDHLPPPLTGLQVVEHRVDWTPTPVAAGVVVDRRAGLVSLVVEAHGSGFAVASPAEQDGLVAAWGAALAPLARVGSPVGRVTWQHWTHPTGVDGHRQFLARLDPPPATAAARDYEELLGAQAPVTVGHDVLLTVTVDLARLRPPKGRSRLDTAIDAAVDETRLLAGRLEVGGVRVGAPLSPLQLSTAVRLRCDPSRAVQLATLRRSLAATAGHGTLEWGPMGVEADWTAVRVDGSVHRTYRVAGWPMLGVAADWLAPLLTSDAACGTRTVTVVMEPVAPARAAADANRQLTSLESDHDHKQRHGFRLTARERRRHADIEDRERELAAGHPEFRHAAFVTVTAPDPDSLEDAAARVEQAAAQAMLDLRLLAARQGDGWVTSLPLGRSTRSGTRS